MTMSDEQIILDHSADIVVSTDTHHNNLTVLRSLEIGMFHLAMSTRSRELVALERHGKDNIVFLSEITDETLMLGCVFDWFAVSLISYMRTIKLLQLMEDKRWKLAQLRDPKIQRKLRKACDSYINAVAPDILQWRNKIAAHRVATDPRSDDLGIIFYSTLPTISYQSPYFVAGALRVTLSGGEPSDLQQWSLTKSYEELAPRYWPDRGLYHFCVMPPYLRWVV